ncbi:hypothetical protein [Sagittula sp. S175]|uniref:hypothetical protein n=1 Tax=Sagittula sp. S175 TaxID=3415129 RepID=UPI003C79772E
MTRADLNSRSTARDCWRADMRGPNVNRVRVHDAYPAEPPALGVIHRLVAWAVVATTVAGVALTLAAFA